VSYATHRLNTSDEVGQPMTAWKLRGELGHGTEQMIEDRYGRYARHRPRRPVLEYRWEEWRERYGHRLAPLPVHLTQGQRGTLALLDGQVEGITATEWAARAQAHPGTFYPQRDRLLALELVRRDRLGRGARFRLTTAGRAVLAGITPGQ
jgi:DNA-binding MarR family transcriptional regulator